MLIASAAAILAFRDPTRETSIYAFDAAAISVLAGIIYNFIFGGSIVEERHNGEPHIVTVVALHQDLMEILLNMQVLAVLFALVTLNVK